MTIHHATAKRAEQNQIQLSEDTDARTVRAEYNGQVIELEAPAKDVLADMITLKMVLAEYSAFNVDTDDGYSITYAGEEIASGERLRDALDDALDYCSENDIDPDVEPEELEEEEPEPSVIVPPKYKEEYKARGNPNHCGDWLAQHLEGEFTTEAEDGPVFDPDAFVECLKLNSIDLTGKWFALLHSDQRGWQGRFRMNGRQKLEKMIATTGILYLSDDRSVQVPRDELERLWEKHPNSYTAWSEDPSNKA